MFCLCENADHIMYRVALCLDSFSHYSKVISYSCSENFSLKGYSLLHPLMQQQQPLQSFGDKFLNSVTAEQSPTDCLSQGYCNISLFIQTFLLSI